MNQVLVALRKTTILLPLLAIVAGVISFMGVQALTSKSTASDTSCQGMCVALREDGMQPNELAVRVGEFVQFNSADGKRHNISIGEGAGDSHGHEPHDMPHEHTEAYASGDFGADEAWRVQFKEPGTYQLHDHYNPKLNILVVVYNSNEPTAIR